MGAVIIRFFRIDVAGSARIPTKRMLIFAPGTLLQEEIAVPIENKQVHGPMPQTLIVDRLTICSTNRPVRIVTKDGKTINGRRLNEDTFTVQIIDDQERMLSLAKSDFRDGAWWALSNRTNTWVRIMQSQVTSTVSIFKK